jgi:hypothetical protein
MQQATVNLFADMGVAAGSLRPGLIQTTKSTDLTRPSSTITSPTGGSFTAGTSVTISGTAQDSGGGLVAAVEVSTDGGATWHLATGKNNWTYTWTPSTNGPATIRSRAVDDSGNIEIPGSGTAVSVTPTSLGTNGLVAAYSFNAGNGNSVADATSNNNNGTISNATWTTGGMFGTGALSFNGSNSWVTTHWTSQAP